MSFPTPSTVNHQQVKHPIIDYLQNILQQLQLVCAVIKVVTLSAGVWIAIDHSPPVDSTTVGGKFGSILLSAPPPNWTTGFSGSGFDGCKMGWVSELCLVWLGLDVILSETCSGA